jgi:hypothetical protein
MTRWCRFVGTSAVRRDDRRMLWTKALSFDAVRESDLDDNVDGFTFAAGGGSTARSGCRVHAAIGASARATSMPAAP